jgi:lipoprotein-anchoring transpeptidase ErfK/SrfK
MAARMGARLALVCVTAAVLAATCSPALAVTAPGTPSLGVAAESLIASGRVITGTADAGTVVTLLANGRAASSATAVSPGGTFALVAGNLPYGHISLNVVSENASGTAGGAPVNAYNLGSTPGYAKYVLVDKSDMMLYFVRNGVVVQASPVAIGMPRTPTPLGTFRLGTYQKKRAGSPWGVRRLPLQRKVRGRWRATSYYIHGNNDPSSIGTWASHGCVRMYNADVLRLSKVTWHVIAVIRR